MALTKIQGLAVDNTPSFLITGNNNAYVTTTPIVFAVTTIDTHNGVDLSNNKYVIPVAGVWSFALNLGIVRTTSAGAVYAQIFRSRSGATTITSGYCYFSPGNSSLTQYGSLSIEGSFDCLVGDEITAIFTQSNGHYYNGPAECRLMGFYQG